MSKGDYIPNIITVSKLLVSSRLKIAWITDVKLKTSAAHGTFGKTGMLFFFSAIAIIKIDDAIIITISSRTGGKLSHLSSYLSQAIIRPCFAPFVEV